MSVFQRIFGGWKTWGPSATSGAGGFASDEPASVFDSVSAESASRLSAVHACMHLRAETIGTLPLHLRDAEKNVVRDNPLYSVLHDSPNAMMTAAEYWSLNTAHIDMHGNAISVVKRRRDKSVISLEPAHPTLCSMKQLRNSSWVYDINGDEYPADDILHLKGFTQNRGWGAARVDIGRHILSAQLTANESATRAFKNSLKVGGFFEVADNLDSPQLIDFQKRLNEYGRPENNGKFMTLLKGMKPIAGEPFRIKPADAELLQSRYFGIEEICRLFGVPPQLIGHTDKSSSWASSIEQINLFFAMYSLQPTLVRNEQRISKTLLTHDDRARGLQPKFSLQGLLRADLKTRQAFYASALQNGYYSRNEVRDLEERGNIPGGDEYTVQLNMTGVDNMGGGDNEPKGDKP